ncbi:YjjG family noncanonical pyrimidine nucleotidase [Dellaglioa sp. P0083]|uniref:YjjG family noncanonical pyrimidine nucleotidase n=1 Tax=Dellaglioa kimchii TaxID=3344667 RepID=UPI0038D48AD6
MKNYEFLLFDIDDTLLDFGLTEKNALEKLFLTQKIALDDKIKQNYLKFNQQLWRQYERGDLKRDQLLQNRFAIFFKKQFNRVVDGKELAKQYQDNLSAGHEKMMGADELLASIDTSNYQLSIITNGVADMQYKRLAESKLDKYFPQIFVSEMTGYQKPSVGFFNYAFDHITGFNPDKALIIGDSLTSDIQGGNNVHVDTVWYNPKNIKNKTSIKATYEIDDLLAINNII